MILIYSEITTARLQYTCDFIFSEQLGTGYRITNDDEVFNDYRGAKINYSNNRIGDSYFIRPHQLLFEQGIRQQYTSCIVKNEQPVFFACDDSDFHFDIFAAVFYLLSRYEEYLPYELDMYGRYAHSNSLACKEGFLNRPLINEWLKVFSVSMLNSFPGIVLSTQSFTFLPTYDIDIAWSYKHKGFIRNLGGFIKSPSADRLKVLAGLKTDPFDSYAFMDRLHAEKKLSPVYFFLVATSGSLYDKNISPYSHGMWQLIKRHSAKYQLGLHPSWRSHGNLPVLLKEKKILETASRKEIKLSRQHYIKLSLPQTYQMLIDAGIEKDYSMGYGSINGFRASAASSFLWYDLENEKITGLRIYPFCFMDANSFYEQRQDTIQSLEELVYYMDTCKNVNGLFISIFHNNFLGNDEQFSGWKELYSSFISQVQG